MPAIFTTAFLQIRLLDVIDIVLVALILFQIYLLIRGTGTLNIFLGIVSVYIIWWLVRIFEMELLAAILGQFISVGVLALIIVFQPEIRKFLLLLGTRSFFNKGSNRFFRIFTQLEDGVKLNLASLVNACEHFSESRTGALIILTRENDLGFYVETGELIDARVSEQLLETIFFKNSPLHDGAVIITNNRVKAARCVLPVSENQDIPANLGMRHRAAAGITEVSDAIALIVSEQTGKISFAKNGELKKNLKPLQLKEILAREFGQQKANPQPEPDKGIG
ncbi:MAG TPA: diadenylate cyclase CdaA [Bacteroidales bacterium]|nr:diadenylate cyclase CdaA [Bacteroidales bacterium]